MAQTAQTQRLYRETSFGGSQESIEYVDDDSFDNAKKGSKCDSCMARIPYATLIATVMCLLGVGVFCGTMYRGAALTVLMFDKVFQKRIIWIEAIQMVFVVIGGSMAALGFMILFLGCLATGQTRHTIYKAWRSRVGGRISCIVFMTITYILQIAWVIMFACLVISTFIYTMFWYLCDQPRVSTLNDCIDLTQFHFMFPNDTRPELLKICGDLPVKQFCKDYVENAEPMFILATVASFLVILSLIHYLMCLSANYAHIRDHTKFQELQDLHYLTDPDIAASKDRF